MGNRTSTLGHLAQSNWLRWARAGAPEQTLAALAGALLLISYSLVFWVTGAANPAGAAARALINVLPAGLLAVLAYRLVQAKVLASPIEVQVVAHPGLALAYALAWYLGIQVAYGLRAGWLTEGLAPRSFSGIAFTWQMFQGVTVYALVATYAYAVAFWREAERLRGERDQALQTGRVRDAKPAARPARLLLRKDREIVPVDPDDIVRVSGAGDKAEVVTRTTRVLTTTTLAELEESLPSDFLRVHRSHLVSLGAVLHAEPAGNGRLTLHLPNGDSVTASRAGTKAFRDAVV